MQRVNIDVFLKDTFKGILRMMAYAQRATAMMVDKNENGLAKSAMILLFYDNPEHNQRILDAVKKVGEEIDAEEENTEQ